MGATKTVMIDLWSGQARGVADNQRTRISRVPAEVARRDLRALFIAAYPRFAAACRHADQPGLAIVAVDEVTGQPAGLVQLRAQVGRHVTTIIGRHDVCDLYLAGHDELALRHLAVIADPLTTYRHGAGCPYRIVDLRSAHGFVDEHDRTLRGLRSDGAAVLRCGGYAVFVLPLGDPTDWPATGEDAWSFLPERIYFDEVSRAAGSSPQLMHAGPPSDRAHRTTHITRVHGPRDASARLVTNGDLAGTLVLEGPDGRQTLDIGDAALDDGVLIGRYERCDSRGVDDVSLSRVHALLIRVQQALLVIDTASTNRTCRLGQPEARVIALDADADLQLGLATIARWRWRS